MTRKTLLEGGHYVPSHATDIRETFRRIRATQNLESNEPLVSSDPLVAEKVIQTTRQVWTLADFDEVLGQR